MTGRQPSATVSGTGRIPDTSLNGVLVIDKPAGMSSAAVVSRVKGLLKVQKAGHAGTLDPFATGLLIVCINQATRLARFWLSGEKTYIADLYLGIETDTQDSTGTVTAVCDPGAVSEAGLRAAMASFLGTGLQSPPVYSALKHQGVPLYRLARGGKPVQKPARPIRIERMEILEIAWPVVRFEVHCSAGTYIRTLCADIGKVLGCGGHLKDLRRTGTCGFTVADAVSLSELEECVCAGRLDRRLIAMAEALPDMVSFQADNALTDKIKYGMIITKADVPPPENLPDGGPVKIVDGNGRLLSLLSYDPALGRFSYCCSFTSG